MLFIDLRYSARGFVSISGCGCNDHTRRESRPGQIRYRWMMPRSANSFPAIDSRPVVAFSARAISTNSVGPCSLRKRGMSWSSLVISAAAFARRFSARMAVFSALDFMAVKFPMGYWRCGCASGKYRRGLRSATFLARRLPASRIRTRSPAGCSAGIPRGLAAWSDLGIATARAIARRWRRGVDSCGAPVGFVAVGDDFPNAGAVAIVRTGDIAGAHLQPVLGDCILRGRGANEDAICLHPIAARPIERGDVVLATQSGKSPIG